MIQGPIPPPIPHKEYAMKKPPKLPFRNRTQEAEEQPDAGAIHDAEPGDRGRAMARGFAARPRRVILDDVNRLSQVEQGQTEAKPKV